MFSRHCAQVQHGLVVLTLITAVSLLSVASDAVAARSAWVTNSTTGSVSKINLENNAVTNIPVGGNTFSVAVTPDGSRAYVPRAGLDSVRVINTVDGSTAYTIDVSKATNVAVSPDGSRAYVTRTEDNAISVVDTTTNQVINAFLGITEASRIAVAPDGNRAYVTSQIDGKVRVVDLTTGAVLKTLAQPGATGVAISPDSSLAYVASLGAGGDKLSVINVATNELIGSGIALNSQSLGVAVSPDGSRVYVTSNFPEDKVTVVDANTLLPIATYAAGVDPAGVAVTPDGSRLYVANNTFPGTATVLNASTGATLATPALETGPYGVAVEPDQGPVADFAVNAEVAGAATAFNGYSSADPDGTVTRYDWDFGDGSTAVDGGPTPTHVYVNGGTYTVTLTVTDNDGTSTTRVYTGQTVSRNGNAAARKSEQVTVPSPPPTDITGPNVNITRPRPGQRLPRKKLKWITGAAADDSGVDKVEYAVSMSTTAVTRAKAHVTMATAMATATVAAKKRPQQRRCRFLQRRGRLGKPRACKKAKYLVATGTNAWKVKLKKALPRGSYTAYARATDGAGNTSTPIKVRFKLR